MSCVHKSGVVRAVLTAVLLSSALTGCDWFERSKVPLPGERVPVLGDRRDLEPDSDVANMQVTLPPPTVNDSWPQSGGFANYAMHNLAIGDSPQIIWTADVGSGTSTSRVLTTPPVVAEGKVFAKDAHGAVSAFNADT
ncbi:MAG: pyrrolo-quinoline quinone, partial [Reyranella sp.]|nr:pyrrolo-quinoline quinone [Reyranella sp.]